MTAALPLDVPETTSPAAGTNRGRPLLEVFVFGKPAPQGSKTRNRYGAIYDDNATALKPWREAVKFAALDAMAAREGTGDPFSLLGGPLYVETVFTFPRPKSHYRTGRNAHLVRDDAPMFHTVKPDIDKCVRATRDALTDAGVWTDDATVSEEHSVKVYPDGHPDAMATAGARIRIWAMS
jgi:Holliday junction resolvase RusA-like endonuclease